MLHRANHEIVQTWSFLHVFSHPSSFSLKFHPPHFFSCSPLLLNKSLSHWGVLLSISSVDTCIWLSTSLFFSVYYHLSASFSFSRFLSLSISQCHSMTLSWIGRFLFSLAANSINKMPSPQLSFPITALLSVRMRVVLPFGEGFSLCWMLNWKWLAACDKTCSSSSKKEKLKNVHSSLILIALAHYCFWSLSYNSQFGSTLHWPHSDVPSCALKCRCVYIIWSVPSNSPPWKIYNEA